MYEKVAAAERNENYKHKKLAGKSNVSIK